MQVPDDVFISSQPRLCVSLQSTLYCPCLVEILDDVFMSFWGCPHHFSHPPLVPDVEVILIVDFFLVNISKINLSLILILLHLSSILYSCGRLLIYNTINSEILKCTTEVLYICVQDSRSRDSNISTTCVARKVLSSELIAFCSSLLLSESLLYFNFASRGVSKTQSSLSACCHHLGRTQKCTGGGYRYIVSEPHSLQDAVKCNLQLIKRRYLVLDSPHEDWRMWILCERNKISCNWRKTIMQIVQNLPNFLMHFSAKNE